MTSRIEEISAKIEGLNKSYQDSLLLGQTIVGRVDGLVGELIETKGETIDDAKNFVAVAMKGIAAARDHYSRGDWPYANANFDRANACLTACMETLDGLTEAPGESDQEQEPS